MPGSVLVTGAAGFIGSHLVDRLLEHGWQVTALDNFDPFYDEARKRRNVEEHVRHPGYELHEVDIRDERRLEERVPRRIDVVVHLAARAGVRPSIADPIAYQEVNVRGTQNLLELCRRRGIGRFIFGSSSSVYGINPRVPWREEDTSLLPVSPYASTKISGELLGHVYSSLYGLRFLALRFFTVYGPRQRPDLAIHRFARLMLRGEPIPVYGDAGAVRDYTYVADIVDGITAAIRYESTPYEVMNLGNDDPIALSALIGALETVLGIEARIDRQPAQPGDVPRTWACIDKATALLGYRPRISLENGLRAFASWLGPDAGKPPHVPAALAMSRATARLSARA